VGYTELVTGVPDGSSIPEVSLVPNPTTDAVTVTLDRAPAPGTVIDLVDARGRLAHGPVPMTTGALTLDMRSLASGAYNLRIRDGGEVRSIPLQKN
jgi:hypothetical protein